MKTKRFIETVAHEHRIDPTELADLVMARVCEDRAYRSFAERVLPGYVEPTTHEAATPKEKAQTTRDRLTHELSAARQAVKSAPTAAARRHAEERVLELEKQLSGIKSFADEDALGASWVAMST
jgi:hypothetical protein